MVLLFVEEMQRWLPLLCLLVATHAQTTDDEERCAAINCVGEQYDCYNGFCFCANGYVPNFSQTGCMPCPGLGEKCFGRCCNNNESGTLHCWKGVCQTCYDSKGMWSCRDSVNQIVLISITQVVMATALILGIIATFILLYKLCAATNIRAFGNQTDSEGRLSIGSLQLYINERLRDAPPRYSSTAPNVPVTGYPNPTFVHDNSIPPPPYTPSAKNEELQNNSVHM